MLHPLEVRAGGLLSLVALPLNRTRSESAHSSGHRWLTSLTLVMMGMLVGGCAADGARDDARPGGETGGVRHAASTPSELHSPPNLLLIVADDLGFTDLGAFGGEIHTPNLDRLALGGQRLTNFHTAPSCAATRAMLLSGTDNHLAGMGSQSRPTPLQAVSPAYRNVLLPEVPTIADHLGAQGYRTLASAKWHLGAEPELLPGRRGFDRSFVLLEGGSGHFGATPLFETIEARWMMDDQPVELPEDFYSTDYMTDQLLGWIGETPTDQPFFAFLGYTAPHWPLQAPPDSVAPYRGVYDEGWDVLRARRMAGARAAGVVPDDAEAVDFEAGMQPWSELNAQEQAYAARKMEIYAGMVHRLDENVGRILEALTARGDLDNTVIVFIADNGAEAHLMEFYRTNDVWVPATFDNSLESMGTGRSYLTLGPAWARATAAPFRASKSKISEGGIRVPAFVNLPERYIGSSAELSAGLPAGADAARIDTSFMRVMDLAPTFRALAGQRGADPASDSVPVLGRSLLKRWQGGASPYDADEVIAGETFGRRMAHQGSWKALLQEAPYGTGEWQLYNLETDLGEQHDLAEEHPEVLQMLVTAWQAYADQVGVINPETPVVY